jgi:hypothetical protein
MEKCACILCSHCSLADTPRRQPNEAYVQYLVQLHNKLEFTATKVRPRSAGRLLLA